jgi:hypothetical protein
MKTLVWIWGWALFMGGWGCGEAPNVLPGVIVVEQISEDSGASAEPVAVDDAGTPPDAGTLSDWLATAQMPEASVPMVAEAAAPVMPAPMAAPVVWCGGAGTALPPLGGSYGETGCTSYLTTPSGIDTITYYCPGQYSQAVYDTLAPLACGYVTVIMFCGDPGVSNYTISTLNCSKGKL